MGKYLLEFSILKPSNICHLLRGWPTRTSYWGMACSDPPNGIYKQPCDRWTFPGVKLPWKCARPMNRVSPLLCVPEATAPSGTWPFPLATQLKPLPVRVYNWFDVSKLSKSLESIYCELYTEMHLLQIDVLEFLVLRMRHMPHFSMGWPWLATNRLHGRLGPRRLGNRLHHCRHKQHSEWYQNGVY